MKFGKRRWEDKLDAKDAASAISSEPPAPIAESWNVPADPEPEPGVAPPTEADVPEEPAVDGEAVELPVTEVPAEAEPAVVAPEPVMAEPEPEPEPVPAPASDTTRVSPIPPPRAPGEPLAPPGARWAPSPPPPPAPPPMPFPVAEEPVLVFTSGSDSPAVTPLAETGEAYASGHAPGTSPSWPEPVVQLASERPEVLVGAAFAGGLLFAMILRRLGN